MSEELQKRWRYTFSLRVTQPEVYLIIFLYVWQLTNSPPQDKLWTGFFKQIMFGAQQLSKNEICLLKYMKNEAVKCKKGR